MTSPAPETSWYDLLLAEETALDRLVAHTPRVAKFRRVLNDERVATRLRVADVARMLGLAVEVVLAIAQGQQTAGTGTADVGDPDECAWAEAARDSVSLDLRPVFANGHEPLAIVMDEIERLPADAALVIDAPFHPLPLRRLLAGRGYESAARCLAADHWRVVFRRVAAA